MDGRLVSSRDWLDPIEWLRVRGVTPPHITFDPDVAHQYRMIRGATHDGTLVFTEETIWRALAPLLTSRSFFKPEPSPVGAVPHYTVGLIRVATVFGKVLLPCSATHRYPGQRDRVTIPVRVEYS